MGPRIEADDFGLEIVQSVEEDLEKIYRGVTVGITENGGDAFDRNLAEEADGHGRAVTAEEAGGDDGERLGTFLIIEDGAERQIDFICLKAINKAAGDIGDELKVGEVFEAVDEREGVEVVDDAQTDGG